MRRHTPPRDRWVQCDPCAKHLYFTRHAAKQAHRINHPEERGRLNTYRCPAGGDGYHLGHRPGSRSPRTGWPTWIDTTADTPCARCTTRIPAGSPAAVLAEALVVVCLDCGDLAEQAAIAHHRRTA